MQLYVTYGSPYAWPRAHHRHREGAREEDRVEIIEAKTRTPGSSGYRSGSNPSGRVPDLIDDTGVGMEEQPAHLR